MGDHAEDGVVAIIGGGTLAGTAWPKSRIDRVMKKRWGEVPIVSDPVSVRIDHDVSGVKK